MSKIRIVRVKSNKYKIQVKKFAFWADLGEMYLGGLDYAPITTFYDSYQDVMNAVDIHTLSCDILEDEVVYTRTY